MYHKIQENGMSIHLGLFHSLLYFFKAIYCPVGWGCRIHRLLHCRGVRPSNECPTYDTKQSDGEVPAMLELWGIRSTPLLLSLPGPLWPGVVAPDKGPISVLNRTNVGWRLPFLYI